MARPAVIRDEMIVEAAREVFLARGIRATTAEVAEKAGVSEGSIFKRFRSKLELFEAAMGSLDEDPEFVRGLPERVGRGEILESLTELGHAVERHMRRVVPLVMMQWSNPGAEPLTCRAGAAAPSPVRVLRALVSYFEAEMSLGRIRRADPEIAARAFIGGIHNGVITELLVRGQDELPLAPEPFLRSFIQLVWDGLAPDTGAGPAVVP